LSPLLVYGLGVTGRAVARALVGRGEAVVLGDDRPGDVAEALAGELGAAVHRAGDPVSAAELVASVAAVVPAPGVPEHHPVIAAALAAGVPVRSELDLAQAWEGSRPQPRPFLAITGTDGKTTVTTMVTEILRRAGRRAEAVGNTEVPLVAALDGDAEVFVVEASSFRLRFCERFHPVVGAWLNLAPDHLDWHPSVEAYADAKARLWQAQRDGDVAIGALDDPIVAAHLRQAPARRVGFSVRDAGAAYRVEGEVLTGPRGPILPVARLPRALPHDVANALAAAATALEAGVALEAVQEGLVAFRHPPHRVAFVAEHAGIRWYDDAKATAPHATVAALRSFDRVVLIAGGRNKGLDLGELAVEAARLRGVVAIGEAAPAVVAALREVAPVTTASSMDAAVAEAARLAGPGDVVLLSPGCASYDWYPNYGARGDDFVRAVRAHLAREEGGTA